VISDVVGERVAQLRRAQGISREDLACLVTAAGWPLGPAAITNLESGRRDRETGRRRREITVDELSVLGRVLGVPPVLLLYPLGEVPKTEIAPGVFDTPWAGVRWFAGESGLAEEDINENPGAAVLVLYRRHQNHVDRFVILTRLSALLQTDVEYSGPVLAPSKILPGLTYSGWLPEHRDDAEKALDGLKDIRAEIRRTGLLLPDLPPELARLESPNG
jgi:transcriptional regulator with XRE-family HTH domain